VRSADARTLLPPVDTPGDSPLKMHSAHGARQYTLLKQVGSIFEIVNRNPIFGVLPPENPLWLPILGLFAVTGLPSAGGRAWLQGHPVDWSKSWTRSLHSDTYHDRLSLAADLSTLAPLATCLRTVDRMQRVLCEHRAHLTERKRLSR